MMTNDQIKTATDADLSEWMANAVATQSCTGHPSGPNRVSPSKTFEYKTWSIAPAAADVGSR